jgi:hypothetical protein
MNKGHDGHDKILIGNKLYSRRILLCTVFLRTVNVRSTAIITDYVGMVGVISPKVDL